MEASDKEAKGYSLLPGIDSLYFFISCETELYHNFYKLVDSGDYQKFENYSFQYKISKIMGTIALFNTIYRISTQRTQRDKMRKCEFSLYMSFFTLLSFHLAFKFKVNYFMIQTRCAV